MAKILRICMLLAVFMLCAARTADAFTNDLPDVRALQQAITGFVNSELAQDAALISSRHNLAAPQYIAAQIFEYDHSQCSVAVEFGGPAHVEVAKHVAARLCSRIGVFLQELGMSREQCIAAKYFVTVIPYAKLAGGNWIYGASSMYPGSDNAPFWVDRENGR